MAPKKSLSHRARRCTGGAPGQRWPLDQPHEPAGFVPTAARARGAVGPIHWPATLLERFVGGAPDVVYRRALTQSPAELHLIVLDESGSMGRGQRLAAAKGYAVALLQRLARWGQSVAVLSFGGAGVRPLVWPQRSRRALAQPLRMLGAAGGTPLDAALRAAQELVQCERRQGAGAAVLWLLTDGRVAQSPPAPQGFDALHLVDFDGPRVRAGRCRDWARAWGGQWWDGWAAVAPGSGGHHVGLA